MDPSIIAGFLTAMGGFIAAVLAAVSKIHKNQQDFFSDQMKLSHERSAEQQKLMADNYQENQRLMAEKYEASMDRLIESTDGMKDSIVEVVTHNSQVIGENSAVIRMAKDSGSFKKVASSA